MASFVRFLGVAVALISSAAVAGQVPNPVNAVTGMSTGHIFESTSNTQQPQDGGILGSMANQSAGAVAITGGSILNTPISGSTGSFAGLTATGSFTATGLVTLPDLATQATNTLLGNATSGSASPTALSIGGCSTSASALNWTTNTGFGCNSAINAATLGGNAIGTNGGTVPLNNGGFTQSGSAIFTGGANFGSYAGGFTGMIFAGQNFEYFQTGTESWALNNIGSRTGNNAGSKILLGAYSDSGSFTGSVFEGVRASGPFGDGAPYFDNFAPYSMQVPRITVPNGVAGNDTEFSAYDLSPTETLAANPLSTVNTSASVTVLWNNCCVSTGPIGTAPATNAVWVNLTGATAVGGLTLSGWYPIVSIVDGNDFTITAASAATSTATGGGSAVQVKPSSANISDKYYSTATTGASGFPVQHVEYFVANPSFYEPTASGTFPQYEQRFSQVYSPTDSSKTNGFGTLAWEADVINRASDEGYSPDLYTAARPTIGIWAGPESSVASFVPGGGTAKNWNTIFSCFQSNGIVGIYDCNSVQKNALVGAANDPSGHGGVGYDFFGAYEAFPANPFTTASGTSTITIAFPANDLATQTAGNTVYLPVSYTINGVTFGAGQYTFASVNSGANTATITGSGTAGSSGSGGGSSQWGALASLVPYAPEQFKGEWKHGIVTTNFKSDSGAIIETQPGYGISWNDGTGTASVTSTELSSGNIQLAMTPAGTGQSLINRLALPGSSTGATLVASANSSATNYTLTAPAITDTLVTLTAPQALTNKTIAYASNTLTGVAPTASPTFTGTITNPDGSTWTSSGESGAALIGATTLNGTTAVVAGTGDATASPVGQIVRAPNASGANIGGGTLTISAGASTGTGAGGVIILETCGSGSTGSSPNNCTEIGRINNAGFIFLGGSSAATRSVIINPGGANQLTFTGTGAGGTISTNGGPLNLTSSSGVVNINGSSVTPALSGTTGSIGGGALLAGACTSGTVTVTGATTAMVPSASPVTYPGDGFDWSAYVSSANTVTVKVCGFVAGTPTATTYNVRVLQ